MNDLKDIIALLGVPSEKVYTFDCVLDKNGTSFLMIELVPTENPALIEKAISVSPIAFDFVLFDPTEFQRFYFLIFIQNPTKPQRNSKSPI